jgi:hypothetical protein
VILKSKSREDLISNEILFIKSLYLTEMEDPSLEATNEYEGGISADGEYRSDYFEDINPKLSLKKVVEEIDPSCRKTRVVCTLG